MECEECGRTDKPLLVFVFSLKDNSDPNKLHTDSLYLCQECLEKANNNEISPTIH